jgi:hemin uptake protein HemP
MNAKIEKKSAPTNAGADHGATPGLRRLSVAALLAGDREVILEHDGQDYRLRITANGKLILTK